jgi:hypothetical protein
MQLSNFYSIYYFRYDELCSFDEDILDDKISFVLDLLHRQFEFDISIDYFFNPKRFANDCNFRSIANRFCMCLLLERDFPLLIKYFKSGYVISASSSHANDAGVVCYMVSNLGLRIGIDVEPLDRVITDSVASYISNDSDHFLYSLDLLKYWVLKESIFKSKFRFKSLRDVHVEPFSEPDIHFSIFNGTEISLATTFKVSKHLVGLSFSLPTD